MFTRLIFALVFACIFAACGDDSSSSVSPEPAGDSSSSVIPALSGDESSSSQKNSGKDKSSSSVKSGDDSQKSSSSVSGKNSSSSVDESSSSSMRRRCEEGSLDTMVVGNMVGYYECRNNTLELVSYVELSSSSIPSSDAHYDMTEQYYCNGSPDKCDRMSDDYTDPRDRQVYKTLVFQQNGKDGTLDYRFRIFASNLNYGKQIMSDAINSDDGVVEKYCYNDDEWYCDNGFGGMYTWSEAMGLPKACDSLFVDSSAACKDDFVVPEGHSLKLGEFVQRQGVCPEGWHIMNDWEWLKLKSWSGGALASPILWTATNVTGFSALPVGSLNDGKFESFGMLTLFWKPQEKSESNAMMHEVDSKYQMNGTPSKLLAVSIRCVEDYDQPLWD